MQETEAREYIRQSKVERAKSQDCEGIRGIHDKCVARDSQDRRDRIHSKNNIHGFYRDQREEKRRGVPSRVLFHEEPFSLVFADYWKKAASEANQPVASGIDDTAAREEHANTGEE